MSPFVDSLRKTEGGEVGVGGQLHVVLLGQEVLDLHQQLFLDGIRHGGAALRCDVFHEVIQRHIGQTFLIHHLQD